MNKSDDTITLERFRKARDSAALAQRVIDDALADRKQDFSPPDEMTTRYYDACHEIEDLTEKLKLNDVKLNQLRQVLPHNPTCEGGI